MNAYVDHIAPWIQAWAIASLRLLACWSVVPVFGRQLLPGLLRVGVVLSLSLAYVPFMRAALQDASVLEHGLIAIREVFIGLCAGMCIALVFWVVEGLAAVIDAQSGVQAGAMLNPLSASEDGVFAGLMYWTFIAYFFSVGGLRWMIDVLDASYRIWPVGVWSPHLPAPLTLHGARWWLGLLDGMAAAVVTLAAPVIVSMLLVELSLGLVGRFAPQLQVFFVAMPIKLMVALLMLAFQLSSIFAALTSLESGGVLEWVTGLRGALGGGENRATDGQEASGRAA